MTHRYLVLAALSRSLERGRFLLLKWGRRDHPNRERKSCQSGLQELGRKEIQCCRKRWSLRLQRHLKLPDIIYAARANRVTSAVLANCVTVSAFVTNTGWSMVGSTAQPRMVAVGHRLTRGSHGETVAFVVLFGKS